MKNKTLLLFFVISLCCLSLETFCQRQISMGIFTGFSIPFTLDKGISFDPRYQSRKDLKFIPLGLSFEYNVADAGLFFSPSYTKMGQNFSVINTLGGKVGKRNIDVDYLLLPIGFKFGMMHNPYFRLSFVWSSSFGYLLKATETLSHQASTLNFPLEVIPILPPDYTIQADGIASPSISQLPLASKNDFNNFQVFGGLGLKAEWFQSSNWKITLDLTGNYGFMETRNEAKIQSMKNYQELYMTYGNRREVFFSLTLGLSRLKTLKKKNSNPNKTQSFKSKKRK